MNALTQQKITHMLEEMACCAEYVEFLTWKLFFNAGTYFRHSQ